MTALEKEKKYTSDEFFAMSDLKGRYELIDGVIYDMSPSPNTRHEHISRCIYNRVINFINENNGEYEAFDAPFDVRLNDYTTVQPDIFVVCDPDKSDENRCNGVPDWVIEILSPSDERHDTVDKLYKYSAAGVREYRIVDPDEQRVIVYPFSTTKITGIFTFDDEIPVGIYKDAPEPLSICINKLMNR